MADVELGPFSASCHEGDGTVTVSDGDRTLVLASADCASAIETVAYGASLLDVPVLPPKVPGFGNFDLEFTATGSFLVGVNGQVAFDKTNQEQLIRLIDVALNKLTDSMRLRGGPRRGASGINTPDPVI